MNGSLSARKISGKTGRSGQVMLNDQPTLYAPIKRLIQALSTEKAPPFWMLLLTRPTVWPILKELASVATPGLHGQYFRSRRFPEGASPESSGDLGPPPPERQSPGRYTAPGSLVFYLSRNPKTAALEAGDDSQKPRVFLQKYQFDLPSIIWIRLDPDLEARAPRLNFLMLESEYLPEESHLFPYPYRATQFLAFLCRLLGILAIEYPSVRGRYVDDSEAVNLVILGEAVATASTMSVGEPSEHSDAA